MVSRHLIGAALAAAALLVATSPSLADATIKVSLVGESMEKMGMKLDTDTVKAGDVSFVVTNDALKTGHEMIVTKLNSRDDKLPLDLAKHRVNEKEIKSLGEVSNLKAGQHGTLKVKLAAGDYLLICNIKGHYEAGMVAALTVTP